MAVSIAHRATGTILALVGVPMLLWFVLAIAGGPVTYAPFAHIAFAPKGVSNLDVSLHVLFVIAAVVVSWAWFQHLFSGLRHLFLDMGAGFELKANRTWAIMTFVGSVTATVLLWTYIFLRGAH